MRLSMFPLTSAHIRRDILELKMHGVDEQGRLPRIKLSNTVKGYERICILADKECKGARDQDTFYTKCIKDTWAYLRCVGET